MSMFKISYNLIPSKKNSIHITQQKVHSYDSILHELGCIPLKILYVLNDNNIY